VESKAAGTERTAHPSHHPGDFQHSRNSIIYGAQQTRKGQSCLESLPDEIPGYNNNRSGNSNVAAATNRPPPRARLPPHTDTKRHRNPYAMRPEMYPCVGATVLQPEHETALEVLDCPPARSDAARRRIRDERQQQFFRDFKPSVLKISIHFALLDVVTMELRSPPSINPVRTSPARGATRAAIIPHPRIPHSIRAPGRPEQCSDSTFCRRCRLLCSVRLKIENTNGLMILGIDRIDNGATQ
jgi:hypothetical protein